jgi:hypothetical protein
MVWKKWMGDMASLITQLVPIRFVSFGMHEIKHTMLVNQKVNRAIIEVDIAIKRIGMYAVGTFNGKMTVSMHTV